jgi:hypothetical protein
MIAESMMRNFEAANHLIDRPGLNQIIDPDSIINAKADGSSYFWLPPNGKKVWMGVPLEDLTTNKELYTSMVILNAHLTQMRKNLRDSIKLSRDLMTLIESEP